MQAVMLICRADTNIILMLLMDAVIKRAWNLLKKQYRRLAVILLRLNNKQIGRVWSEK
jgi:hypothetical protein